MSKPIYTNDAKLNDQVVTWMAKIESEKIDPSSMASIGVAEYMVMYSEQLLGDGDVIAELYRQQPNPEKFRLEITVVDRENSSLEFTVDEPSATYDAPLATFKDAVEHLGRLGWIDVEPTLEWVAVDDDDTACSGESWPIGKCCDGSDGKGSSIAPVCTGTGSYFCSVNSIMANCPYPKKDDAKLENERLRSALNDADQDVEYLSNARATLVDEKFALIQELEEVRTKHEQELDELNFRHEEELEVTRNSWAVLLDICDNPRMPSDTEEQAAMSVARNVLHGEKLDIETIENLARENGLDLCTLIVEGIKRG